MPASSKAGGALFAQTIKAKTAAYTISADESGVLFTNRGATAAITFTLPLNSSIPVGWWCEFYGISATGYTVASNPSDTMVVLNDATADTLTMTTTSLIIGAYLRVIYDGTGWLTVRGSGNTYTVAT